jgi:hypothetical protein
LHHGIEVEQVGEECGDAPAIQDRVVETKQELKRLVVAPVDLKPQ